MCMYKINAIYKKCMVFFCRLVVKYLYTWNTSIFQAGSRKEDFLSTETITFDSVDTIFSFCRLQTVVLIIGSRLLLTAMCMKACRFRKSPQYGRNITDDLLSKKISNFFCLHCAKIGGTYLLYYKTGNPLMVAGKKL